MDGLPCIELAVVDADRNNRNGLEWEVKLGKNNRNSDMGIVVKRSLVFEFKCSLPLLC